MRVKRKPMQKPPLHWSKEGSRLPFPTFHCHGELGGALQPRQTKTEAALVSTTGVEQVT